MSYRRCESSVAEMMRMIDIEVRFALKSRFHHRPNLPFQVSELDDINNELADGNVGIDDIENR